MQRMVLVDNGSRHVETVLNLNSRAINSFIPNTPNSLQPAQRLSGRLPDDAQVQDITAYLLSVTRGLTILARRGKAEEELRAVGETAVSALAGIG